MSDEKNSHLPPSNLPTKTQQSETDEVDGHMDEFGRFIRNNGMSWPLTAFFLIGEMAGAGLIAMPYAVSQLDFYPGLALCVVTAVISTTTAVMLGNSWVLILKNHPEYRQAHIRQPFAEIGLRAFGKGMKEFVTYCLYISQFGSTAILLLLTAKNLHDALDSFFDAHIHYCYVVIVVSLLLLPLMFLKSPKNFWWVIIFGMACTGLAICFFLVGVSIDYPTCFPHATPTKFKPVSVFSSIGTIIFSFGGHSVFPTIQHDMTKPHKFYKSTVFAFCAVFLLYAPVIVLSQITYGSSLRASVINSIQTKWIQQTINLLIMSHCFVVIVLMINPMSQSLESQLNVPQEFGWKRALMRTTIMAALLFVSETIPNFGPLMDLIGGSIFNLTGLILPVFFYLSLLTDDKEIAITRSKPTQNSTQTNISTDQIASQKRPTLKQIYASTSCWMLVLCGIIVVFAIFTGFATTVSAIMQLTSTHFRIPCYVLPFLKQESDAESLLPTYCCGNYQNITWISNYTSFSSQSNEHESQLENQGDGWRRGIHRNVTKEREGFESRWGGESGGSEGSQYHHRSETIVDQHESEERYNNHKNEKHRGTEVKNKNTQNKGGIFGWLFG
ncbi:Aa-trans domain-containing protein [Aphelenchoides besseyi]|nr:Aa-trans domain-containing protein [Aphelenchoides besseyi]